MGLRLFLLLCLLALFTLLGSCGSRSERLQSGSALDLPPRPANLSDQQWSELGNALEQAIQRYSSAANAGGPPTTPKSKVGDLMVTFNGASPTFSWGFSNYGDYDQNGVVSISDLTPLGVNLGKTPSAPSWPTAQLADGDKNNEVNIADVTPIGSGLGAQMTGYILQASNTADADGAWAYAGSVPLTAGTLPNGGGYKHFMITLPDISLGSYYRVLPYDGDPQSSPALGIASDAIAAFSNPPPVIAASQGQFSDRIQVSWTALAGALSYDVYRDASPTAIGNSVTTTYDDTTVPDFGTHTYRVKAVYVTGESVLSNTASGFMSLRGPWWTFGADASRTRRSPQAGPATNQLSWAIQTPGAVFDMSSPILGVDGRIFIGNSGINPGLMAFGPDGSPLYTYPSDLVRSSPTMGADGSVYFVSEVGQVLALDPEGSKKWTYFLPGTVEATSPLIDNLGQLYFGSLDNDVHVLTQAGGYVRWLGMLDDVHGSAALMLNGDIAVGSDQGRLCSFAADTGFLGLDVQVGRIEGSPAITPEGDIICANNAGSLVALHPDGSQSFSLALGGNKLTSPALASDGAIYVGSDNHNLYCTNPNGSPRWNYPMAGAVTSSPAVGSDDTVYVADETGRIDAIDTNGNMVWEFQAAGKITSSLALSNNKLYAADATGYLYCFGPELAQPPQPVTSLVAEDGVQQFSIKLTWSTSYNADDYKIYKDGGASPIASVLAGTLEWTDLPVGDTDVHTYSVVASNEFGDSAAVTDTGWANGLTSGPGEWNMGGQEPGGTHYYSGIGPSTNAETWFYSTGLQGYYSGASSGNGKEIYFTVQDTDPGIGKLVSVTKDGVWRWDFYPTGLSQPGGVPAIGDDGTVYFGTGDEVYAVYDYGQKRWSVPIPGGAGSIAYYNDKLYFVTGFNETYCISAIDGQVAWINPHGYHGLMPAIGSDGSVYVADGNHLYILDAAGSDKPFNYGGAQSIDYSPAVLRDAVNGDRVYYESADSVFCYDDDDNQIYQFKVVGGTANSGIAVMPDGTAYASIYPNLYRINPDGTTFFGLPNLGRGRLCCDQFGSVFTNDDEVVNCVSHNGTLLWSANVGADTSYGWPSLNDNTYYVLTVDGKMHAFSD